MQAKSKTIAKNTLFLSLRMLFLLAVNLYTSRVLLENLGINDFGIYNVVGGIVTMFSIISGSITASIVRYITFEMGLDDSMKLKKVFSTSVIVQLFLSAMVFLLLETIGLWFLNTQMNIDPERMHAANWVFQFSIVTFIVNLISVPYNALIIAHEKMSAFAYISIFDGISKFTIAYIIAFSIIDRLVIYSFLLCILSLIVRVIYTVYCNKNFAESKILWHIDFAFLKSMCGFAGWNFIGASAGLLRDQGGNIILNIFFGPSVNASRAIAYQVSAAVQGFVSSFTTSLNPQITKSYASGDSEYLNELLFKGSKFSFYILFLFSFPLWISADYILTLWLGKVPEYSIVFVRLVLILSLIETISMPLITAMLATGSIKKYQIIVGGLNFLNLPMSLLCLWLGAIPESVFLIAIILSFCCLFARIILLKSMINLQVSRFFKDVLLAIFKVVILCVSLMWVITTYVSHNSFNGLILTTLFSIVIILSVVFSLGLTKSERTNICSFTRTFLSRLKLM